MDFSETAGGGGKQQRGLMPLKCNRINTPQGPRGSSGGLLRAATVLAVLMLCSCCAHAVLMRVCRAHAEFVCRRPYQVNFRLRVDVPKRTVRVVLNSLQWG